MKNGLPQEPIYFSRCLKNLVAGAAVSLSNTLECLLNVLAATGPGGLSA